MSPSAALAAAWTALILGLCWSPRSWIDRGARAVPGGFELGELNVDKAVHLALFLGFAVLWRRAGLPAARTAAAGIALAVVSEVAQGFLPIGRTTHLVDLLCNVAGLALGLAVVRAVRRREPAAASSR